MAAANARIGVARAAYYPTIDLVPTFGGPNAGWQSNALSTLFEAPSVFWSIGLSVDPDTVRCRENPSERAHSRMPIIPRRWRLTGRRC